MKDIPGLPAFEWFAIRTKSNREAVVTEALSARGLEAWCPRYHSAKPPSRTDARPVFPGYLFCRFDVNNRLPVLTAPGILNILSNGRIPLPINDDEIESLRVVLDSLLPVAAHEYFAVGDKVTITTGPLKGANGYVANREPGHLVVSITLLQRSVSVVVEDHWLEKACALAA